MAAFAQVKQRPPQKKVKEICEPNARAVQQEESRKRIPLQTATASFLWVTSPVGTGPMASSTGWKGGGPITRVLPVAIAACLMQTFPNAFCIFS